MKQRRAKRSRLCEREARRRGSILVCVLVVLFLTGMMAIHGTRLLLASARAGGARAKLEQCQELLALGRTRLAQQLERDRAYAGETLKVEIRAAGAEDETEAIMGEIRIEKLRPRDVEETAQQDTSRIAGAAAWRVSATAPLGETGPVTAHWETE